MPFLFEILFLGKLEYAGKMLDAIRKDLNELFACDVVKLL